MKAQIVDFPDSLFPSMMLIPSENAIVFPESFPKLLDELERKTRDIIRDNAKLLEKFNSQNNKAVTFSKTEMK